MNIETRKNRWCESASNAETNFLYSLHMAKEHLFTVTADCQIRGLSQDYKRASFLANTRSTLERAGYDVAIRCNKYDVLQIEVGWKGLPLVVATVEIIGDSAYLHSAAGLQQKDIKDKTGHAKTVQTSHKAFNDLMHAELEALAPVVSKAEGSLQGYGSSDWFQRNLPAAVSIQQGNRLMMVFKGDMYAVDTQFDADAILEEARKNATSWNDTNPDFDFAAITVEEWEQKVKVPVYRDSLLASIGYRNINGATAATEPGWNGVCGSSRIRDELDRIVPYRETYGVGSYAELVSIDDIEEAFGGWVIPTEPMSVERKLSV